MTEKAIEIVYWIINNKTKTIEELYQPGIIDAKYDLSENLYRTLLKVAETDVYNLQVVKKQLVPDCKHSPEMLTYVKVKSIVWHAIWTSNLFFSSKFMSIIC